MAQQLRLAGPIAHPYMAGGPGHDTELGGGRGEARRVGHGRSRRAAGTARRDDGWRPAPPRTASAFALPHAPVSSRQGAGRNPGYGAARPAGSPPTGFLLANLPPRAPSPGLGEKPRDRRGERRRRPRASREAPASSYRESLR